MNTTENTTTPQSDLTLEEITESLTGFDEIAIEKHAGADLMSMQDRPTRMIRALIGVDLSRKNGKPYAAAYQEAMGLSMKDVMDYFSPDDEVMPDEPVTESGEDDGGHE